MGVCWCKEKHEPESAYLPQQDLCNGNSEDRNSSYGVPIVGGTQSYLLEKTQKDPVDAATVDTLVLETLSVIGSLVDNEQEPPPSMLRLHHIADHEEGWIQLVKSMVNVIPLDDPLGASVIILLLDDCPLPSRDTVQKVTTAFELCSETGMEQMKRDARKERNICVVLGCVAEKLAGPTSLGILTDNILDYLIGNLNSEIEEHIILFSMIALEKFAQTTENKTTIWKRLQGMEVCPISYLEKWANETDLLRRQVGFCAQWVLDNLFILKNRKYSYETMDMSNIGAMLNTSDVSEYLKISPDGLEARCDAYSFESVRCTAQADSGVWYYEVLIVTSGVMQIGWATKNSKFLNHEGYGIGDDMYSLAYDGCRRLIWYNAKSEFQNVSQWKSGDILGCLLDLKKPEIVFILNGQRLPPCTHVFTMATSGFFPAASFMSFQHCRFNFGAEPFRYPPDIPFSSFNDHNTLKSENKVVMPRHIFLKKLMEQSIGEDCCTLCYDVKASVRLIPCDHGGFCTSCAFQLNECPMCRTPIHLVIDESGGICLPTKEVKN
ncbi:RING finger and SPRY domain-containing protein 1 [Agrilus planipennis]|uniref:RING finger and SPRY domain-containing protein 1 n=1 Tax=Agrilus planipennis TaxID=224129 RepID=A0A1W4WNC8_AGRPL|nr:RING finger and SPRY domain-containing protein 1 [Agrilus planipennis]XP_018325425.1 RING finger and SPRY domain-containing protein 1 [Agrilus planipennis]